jgi:glycosyltransferase involved in cell wall biosynthesis
LHIQHEHSLFNDVALTQFVQHAKLARVPVIITEHSVTPGIYGWERDADVLLALTEHGAAMLRAQHPNKHVALMPHGCPTWFPQRKQRRGRVIGAFGFLEPHKGFWHLLDLLRALPDTELLLFSYAKNEKLAASWDEAAQHLPVRRVTQYMPTSEIARRLAAEADVLVFWYDQPLHAASSGAARVGLATGVPVMTSRTGWFADLHEVTYQPSSLIDGVARLLDDTVLREQLVEAANEYCHAHSWPSVAERHRTLWRSVESV